MPKHTTLHFGVKTTQYAPYEDILRVWLEAETVPDIEHAWLFDHPMPIMRANQSGSCLDGWTLLAALAGQTTRLRLGLLVASNVNQTPPWLAKRAATVDIISRGRLEFGLGAGGVEREHEAYGTDFFPAAERIRRLDEACQIIKRLWTEPVVDYEGRCYHFKEAYCAPKPVQQPTPPFIIGATGEQLSLRVAARHADVWNCPGFPHMSVEDFARKSQVIDGFCRELGRDPASLARSVQITFDPSEPPAATRQVIQGFIDAGATHLVLAPRAQQQGIAHWLSEEIIQPLKAANA
jgi:alkanesulfonate monooxygenase SsuD/methylene tetrahydromethanopterin reductase-like flavin-dependent oxidoreductase (luciferase family)